MDRTTSTPSLPMSPAPAMPSDAADYSGLIWQQLRDVQHTIGAVQETQARLSASIDRLDARFSLKIDGLDDKLIGRLDGIRTDLIEVKAEIKGMKSSIDSTKSKVEDLANWKHMIIGGAIVLGVVGTLLGFAISKASDYLMLKTPPVTILQPNIPKP